MATLETPWGPNGETVFKRTYSRQKPDGNYETWPETVDRVARGNLRLVYGDETTWDKTTWYEFERLTYYMSHFAIIPAGRQLWASGVEGRQFLFNCHVSGWGDSFSDHFAFTFMRLVEGGGVGANYSTRLFEHYGAPKHPLTLILTADPFHIDYEKMAHNLVDGYDDANPDYIADTREGWADAIRSVIDEAMSPYGRPDRARVVSFDLTKIRAEGSPLVSSGGVASGPAPLAQMLHDIVGVLNHAWAAGEFTPIDIMEMDHIISVGAIAGGKRRSARMSMCHWADPHVMDFITSKEDGSKYWTTNISVEIDNEFLRYLEMPVGGTDQKLYQAHAVHAMVCESVLKNGEPGYWNSDLSNEGEVGKIIATNPCGEIPLEAWEACNLGHVNLDWFVDKEDPLGYNYVGLVEAHRLVTRFLVRSTFGDITDPLQKEIQNKNRRIGVGHMGVQAFFVKAFEMKYSEVPHQPVDGLRTPGGLLDDLYKRTRQYATEYCFQLRIPSCIKVSTVAPTGSTAKLPGTTEGIGAIIAKWFEQRIRFSLKDEREFEQVLEYKAQGFTVEDDVYDKSGMTAVVVFPTENTLVSQVRELGLNVDLVESADELTIRDMLAFQAFYQEHWADNAVSYTANIPAGSVTVTELEIILREYLPRLKGTTIMVDATREQAPYTRISQEEYAVADAKRQSEAIDLECASGACPIK